MPATKCCKVTSAVKSNVIPWPTREWPIACPASKFHDPDIDLAALRASAHARFSHSLLLVLENKEHLCDTREEWLAASRAMLIAACRKKGWPLSRLGLAGNHLHLLFGCDIDQAPRDAALSLINNLAYAHGMKAVYEYSFYVGTFGPYDSQAIRRQLIGGRGVAEPVADQ